MSGFGQSLGQLGQQSTGSLGSSLGLGNSGLPISSPSQAVYQASYGLNSLGKLILYTDYANPQTDEDSFEIEITSFSYNFILVLRYRYCYYY